MRHPNRGSIGAEINASNSALQARGPSHIADIDHDENATEGRFFDGEVLELSSLRTVLQWDGSAQSIYDSGETLEEFGIQNLFEHEIGRVGVHWSDWDRAVKVSLADKSSRHVP
jgi:hypothetical protein